MSFFSWSSRLDCSAACCGEKPEIFVGAALKARLRILFPKRKPARVRSATAENFFTESDEGFFTGVVISTTLESMWRKLLSVAQRSSAGDAGVGAVVSGEQWDFTASRIDAPTRNACSKSIKERSQHAGDTAANYD